MKLEDYKLTCLNETSIKSYHDNIINKTKSTYNPLKRFYNKYVKDLPEHLHAEILSKRTQQVDWDKPDAKEINNMAASLWGVRLLALYMIKPLNLDFDQKDIELLVTAENYKEVYEDLYIKATPKRASITELYNLAKETREKFLCQHKSEDIPSPLPSAG
jgi:hypothetical protein